MFYITEIGPKAKCKLLGGMVLPTRVCSVCTLKMEYTFTKGGISTSWAPKSTYPLDGDIIRHTVRRKLGSNVLGVKIPNGKVSVKLLKFAVKLCSFLSFQRIYPTTRRQNIESTLHTFKRFERCSV